MLVTPDNITTLKENEIFVFGSNLAGRHGRGGARFAVAWGAKYGIGVGLQGQTYAIPTKDKDLNVLSTVEIGKYVDSFIWDTTKYPDYTFLVTSIGCGLARYSPESIAPLFKDALLWSNIALPQSFLDILI